MYEVDANSGINSGTNSTTNSGTNNGAGRGISGRIASIDCFRGFTIIMMVFVNYLGGVLLVPGWLKHAPDIGLTMADIVAPAFIFAIGLTYKMSFDGRAAREGFNKTYYHFITRFLAITGIGAIFTGGAALIDKSEAIGAWGVLQAIGAAGLIALILIRAGTLVRFVSGFGLLIIYQIMLDKLWLTQVLSATQGGLQAALSWGAMLLVSTALADLFYRKQNKRFYALASSFILVLGLLSLTFSPVSKHRVSMSYVLISVGISALVFLIFDIFIKNTGAELKLLEWWGRNPLFLYVVQMILLIATYLPGSRTWYAGASVWSALCQFAIFFAILSLIAWQMDKRRIYIKL